MSKSLVAQKKSPPQPRLASSVLLQRRRANGQEPESVPPIVHEVLRSPGQPLDKKTRDFFEPRFGHDFSKVRVHTDAKAAESATAVNAEAYTVGQDVVFGEGKYSLSSNANRRILAHELTHVVQQSSCKQIKLQRYNDSASDLLEQQAKAIEDALQCDGASGLFIVKQQEQEITISYEQLIEIRKKYLKLLSIGLRRVKLSYEIGVRNTHKEAEQFKEENKFSYFVTFSFRKMPDISTWEEAFLFIQQAERALDTNQIHYAAISLIEAAKSLTLANKKYEEFYERAQFGSECAIEGLEIIRDVSFMSVGIMATVATGGIAAGAAIGTGITTIGTISQQAVEQKIGLREDIDWAGISFDATMGFVTSLITGGNNPAKNMLVKKLFSKIISNPYIKKIGEKAVTQYILNLIANKFSTMIQMAARAVFDNIRKDKNAPSWETFIDQLIHEAIDPKVLIKEILMMEAGKRIHTNAERRKQNDRNVEIKKVVDEEDTKMPDQDGIGNKKEDLPLIKEENLKTDGNDFRIEKSNATPKENYENANNEKPGSSTEAPEGDNRRSIEQIARKQVEHSKNEKSADLGDPKSEKKKSKANKKPSEAIEDSSFPQMEEHPLFHNVLFDTTIKNFNLNKIFKELQKSDIGIRIMEEIKSGKMQVVITKEGLAKDTEGLQLNWKSNEVNVVWHAEDSRITASTFIHEGAHYFYDIENQGSSGSMLLKEADARMHEYEYNRKVNSKPFDRTEKAYRDTYQKVLKETNNEQFAQAAAEKAMIDDMKADSARTGVESSEKEATLLRKTIEDFFEKNQTSLDFDIDVEEPSAGPTKKPFTKPLSDLVSTGEPGMHSLSPSESNHNEHQSLEISGPLKKRGTKVIDPAGKAVTTKGMRKTAEISIGSGGILRRERISIKKPSGSEYTKLRNDFDRIRQMWLKRMAKDQRVIDFFGANSEKIKAMQNGNVPEGYEVHHNHPIDAGGQNLSENLSLIPKEIHTRVTSEYNDARSRGLGVFEFPIFDYFVPGVGERFGERRINEIFNNLQ